MCKAMPVVDTQNAFCQGLHASFFLNLACNCCNQVLAWVNQATWKLPETVHLRGNADTLLHEQHFPSVVQHKTTNTNLCRTVSR
eukprot:CAMPEP_0172700980 /NCGR_PEP_ID=MMETSP1074-20121228/31297_1 /TAXON_ID=2916 /ORGANISM="Ceratium fusus, Strain PA161109" /LENGTH=83 /DNA_ID=CAMNT_0013522451 /DNA_START=259 /DNA_END=510 /DNA_ORIENTATION=+